MASEININGKTYILPGVYGVVKSGIKNPPLSLPYGNILIIDTGSGAAYGGGSGINGDFVDGIDAVYPIGNIDDFRLAVKGGYWYTLAKPLFQPSNAVGVNGVSTAYYVRAATTTGATMTFSPTGGGSNGGTLTVKCKDEGLIGNGVLTSAELVKGYAFKLSAGVIDTAKYILTYYLGTYTGTASDGLPYGSTKEADAKPIVAIESPEFTTMTELEAWAAADDAFNNYFTITTSTVAGDGSLTAADIVTYASYTLAASGTETFGATDLTAVLTAVAEMRYTFILSDKFNADSQDATNDTYLTHILAQTTMFEKQLFVGGGNGSSTFATNSVAAAVHFNSDRVTVVHDSPKITDSNAVNKIRTWDSLYMAALVLGRIAGKEPQVPGTFKTLPLAGVTHKLTIPEKKQGLQAGVLMVHWDTQLNNPAYCILQAVNTLQNNLHMVNEDGTSREISIRRISAHLNMTLIINARTSLLGQEDGANIHTISDRTLIDWTAGQLSYLSATETNDNIITEFRNITVSTVDDAKFVTYEFKPNFPVNKLIFTGFMVN